VPAFDRWWDVHIAALVDRDHEIESITGIALDISDKVAAAAAQRASEAKSQFLSAMSHELRTPLTSVLGFTDLLERAETRPKERRYLSNIRQSGRYLLHLVSDLLDLAKIEAGKLDVEMGNVSVQHAVSNAVDSMKPVAAEKGLTLRTRVAADLTVRADRIRLDQILLNLLSNAIKFTEKGSITVRASRRGAGTVRISVTDTGPGISEEDQPQVWVEFTQLGFPSEGQGGTGLGLPLARRLAEHMGGRLEVESRLARGSVFILDLASAP
jgi:two-component system sensor histidine kinase BarA